MKYVFGYMILMMYTFGTLVGMELVGKKKLDTSDKIGCSIIAPLCLGIIYGAYLTRETTRK